MELPHVPAGIAAFPIYIYKVGEKLVKVPAGNVAHHGHQSATTDRAVLEQMWRDARSPVGIECVKALGYRPGPKYIVLDIDDKDGKCGSERLAELEEQFGKLPVTAYAQTASGGRHIWFEKDQPVGNHPLAEGIDVRADDGWVVAPGTRTPWGNWTWIMGAPGDNPLLGVPKVSAWVLEQLGSASSFSRGKLTEEDIDECGREAYDLMVKWGGHHPQLRYDRQTGIKSIELARPGKGGGNGCSIGFVGHNVVKIFTGNWKIPNGELELDGVYNVDELLAANGSAAKYPTMAKEAFIGPLAEATRLFDAYEANPACIMLGLLTSFGNMVGGRPYNADMGKKQRARLYSLIVGATAKARKSSTGDLVEQILEVVDKDYVEQRVMGGFGSGQVLIATLKMLYPEIDEQKQGDINITLRQDPRLLIREDEGVRIFKTVNSEGSIHSAVLRSAYDGAKIENRTLKRSAEIIPKDQHFISILAFMTHEELVSSMANVEMLNGFGNRFLYCWSVRTKLVPRLKPVTNEQIAPIAEILRDRIKKASVLDEIPFASEEVALLWDSLYAELENDEPAGMLAKMLNRASSHLMRLALIYALADGESRIHERHLRAAKAAWDYCRATAVLVFSKHQNVDPTGNNALDKLVAKVLNEVTTNPGLKKNDLKQNTSVVNRTNKHLFDRAIELLLSEGKLEIKYNRTGRTGMAAECYYPKQDQGRE